MRNMARVSLIVIFIMLLSSNVYATSEMIDESLSMYDFSEIDRVIKNEGNFNLTFGDVVKKVIMGEVDISLDSIYNYVVSGFLKQYKSMAILFFDIFMIGVSSAFIQNLTNSVKPKSTSAMGNYVCYIALVHILTTSLVDIMVIVTSFLGYIEEFTFASIPIVLGSLAFSGYVGTVYFVQPILIFLTYIISYIFKSVLIQFIFIIATIDIINGITEKDLLGNFCNIGNKVIKWSLGTVCIGYMSILSLIKIGAPISDNLIKKGARTVVGSLPVVGGSLKSAVDTVVMVADATSNALLFGLVLFCIIYSSTYLISLVSYNILFTASTVLIEPIANKNITSALKIMTKYIGYCLSIFAVSVFLFIFSTIVLLI